MSDIEKLVNDFNDCVQNADFEGAFELIKGNPEQFDKKLQSKVVGESLKKTTADRLLLSYIDSVGFGVRQLSDSLHRLEKLLKIRPGALVLAKVWGLGEVKRIDYFYRKITVDFKQKRGHQYAYDVAAETLEFPGEDHILVLGRIDPVRVETMLKENQGLFVKEVLKSFGDMPLVKLEKTIVENGFIKKDEWKSFWEKARATLKQDKLVEVPVKKTDPIILKQSVEDYGQNWVIALTHETDPRRILALVREFAAEGKFKDATEEVKEKITDRVQFALTAAKMTDDALYARLAVLASDLNLSRPTKSEMLEYIWSRHRYLKAMTELPARDVSALLKFLACDDERREKLYGVLTELPYVAVAEVINQFKDDPKLRETVGALMKQPKAPATLVTLLTGKYDQFADWKELPQLIVILMHAIALGEGRQGGETLRMQNIIRRLFSDINWIKSIFAKLDDAKKAMLFERFQASIAWDPSTHHTTVIRMTNLEPSLASHLIKDDKKRKLERETSFKSYAEKKAEYQKLINTDMPANVKRIEFAKSFGDLSENAEYQYAKDEQRQLMQKQSIMQAELDEVKAVDFSFATTDEVMPGVTVTIKLATEEKQYVILGEWDNDIDKGIISSKTRLALAMMGRKVGDKIKVPGIDGSDVDAEIVAISGLSDEIIEWMKVPVGLSI